MITTPATLPRVALLNIGCGSHFHPAWTNLDLHPIHSSVAKWDATQKLAFADASFDGVYHSHLLEHLPPEQALPFLRECHRVLRPGGILRVAIPDLESIARLYLQALEQAWNGDAEGIRRHRWLVLELYDQTTREKSGGAMIEYLHDCSDSSIAWHRLGRDGAVIRTHLQKCSPAPNTHWLRRLCRGWRERLIRWLLGREYPLLQLGRFRRSGEVHLWMYDRVSLRELLTQAGFVHFQCVGPEESAIPDWGNYHLDECAGSVGKPDSLFVEADKP